MEWEREDTDMSELDLKSITIYKTGIGHFVRQGKIKQKESKIELFIRDKDINDILPILNEKFKPKKWGTLTDEALTNIGAILDNIKN